MAIDLAAIGRLIRTDRGGLSQTKYGAKIGLSQGQISGLETGRMREPSHEVLIALEKYFGKLPDSARAQSEPPRRDRIEHSQEKDDGLDPEARKLGEHLARELTEELRNHPERRRDLLRHWYGQIKITRWPIAGAKVEHPPERPARHRHAG